MADSLIVTNNMEEKFNEATRQRPDGRRQLGGALMLIDLPKYSQQIKEELPFIDVGKNSITVFKSENTTITLLALKEGAEMRSGPDDACILMNIYVIEGGLWFESTENTMHLTVGQLLSYSEYSSFKIEATSDCMVLLTIIK